MRAMMVRRQPLAALITLMLIILSACGSTESTAATATVNGPGLIFFYTDN